MRAVVSYDVSIDRSRERVARIFESILTRVQYSVFEGVVPATVLDGKIAEALSLLDASTDSLRIYRLCEACVPRIDEYGRKVEVLTPAVRVL